MPPLLLLFLLFVGVVVGVCGLLLALRVVCGVGGVVGCL